MFQLGEQDKGRFPYDLLNVSRWEDWSGKCPDISYFGVTANELKNIDKLAKIRASEIKKIKEHIAEENEKYERGIEWNAMDKWKCSTCHPLCIKYRI